MSDDRRVCLDLFCGLGGFSAAFEDADNWRVVTVDVEEEFEPDIQADVMDLRPSDLPDADVVLASPPCDRFSLMNVSKYWRKTKTGYEPSHEETRHRITLTYHALGLIKAKSPEYWLLENPRGMMRHVMPTPPKGTVWYCRYGDHRAKPTDLWGSHPRMDYKTCKSGNTDCHDAAPRGESYSGSQNRNLTAAERAKVPYGLSEAILDAVEGRAEQTTLAEATHD